MKNIIAIATITIILAVSGCSKQGPIGPAGPNGTNGTNGTNGANGNANVKMYFFQNDSLTTAHSFYKYLPVTGAVIDSSIVLAYYDPNGNWYPSPGLGVGGAYQTRNYTNPGADSVPFNMSPLNPDGSAYTGSKITLNRVKILVAPASSVFIGKTSPVDFNDYKATMKYFGLKE